MKRVIELCEDSIGRSEQHMIIQCPQCEKCRTCKQIREINASSYNEFVEQQVLDQLVKYKEGENGEPGFFISPLPLKPFEINAVRGNRKTMAAVKKLITMAKEEGLYKIAQILESAYVDDCNSSMACIEDLEEVKERMPEFMRQHGMPIKALAWTGEEAPKELSEDGSINVAGYSWNPTTDKMKVTLPKIFHGEKKKRKIYSRNSILR